MKNVFKISFFIFSLHFLSIHTTERMHLQHEYERRCNIVCDINEHLPVLAELARQCSSVVEIGLRSMVSTWGILQGLASSPFELRFYHGIDIARPPETVFNLAQSLAQANNISFKFTQANDMNIDIETIDMLFIDSLHTYCHLTYELEKFSPLVKKYIAMHDTSAPWGDQDDTEYRGNYSEYPAHYDRTKKGLWPAVEDFLSRHPEWKLYERRCNNHGFTILIRS